jgi:transposase InsO family protein
MADGLSAGQAASAVGVSRATLYRWEKKPEPLSRRPHRPRGTRWTSELARAVEDYRNDNPMWGKRKIAVLLRREGFSCSVSTIGRILAHLVERRAVVPVPILRRRPSGRRIRLTTQERYARRLPKGRKAKAPGELVQIDTLFVNIRPDKAIKHFTAYDPIAKWTVGRVSSEASATSAKSLLDKLLAEAPFPIRGIQVDGGSEFKSVFEAECQARGLELFVLPPKRPDLNGCVERAQSSWRYEFYATYDLPHRIDKLQAFVDAFAHRFNHHRPHDALGGQTPAEYLQALGQRDPPPSHMY